MRELRDNREVIWSETPPFPKNMMMELTNICNHQCVFCGYSKMKRKRTKCDKALMMDVISKAYALGTRELGFYLVGEPFLCEDIGDYVKKAKDVGYEYIYVTTNGALATVDKVQKLIELGLNSIKFSINAAKAETYKRIHGKDDFEAVKKNVIDLFNLRTKLTPPNTTFQYSFLLSRLSGTRMK